MMRTKEKLVYIALGGVLVIFGQLLPNIIASKATAQRAQSKVTSAEFDTVTVRSLRVVDESGTVRAQLEVSTASDIGDTRSSDNVIQVFDRHGVRACSLITKPDGGQVSVASNDGRLKAALAAASDHGYMVVAGNDGTDRVNIGVDSNGGSISIWSGDSKSKASMTVDKNGGLIRVYDNDGKRRAVIDVDSNNNGVIGVLSSDEKPMATIRESEGGGRVLTWSSSGDIVISLP